MDSSWPVILLVAFGIGVPSCVLGYIFGYAKGTRDLYGPDVLQDSVAEAFDDSRSGGS
jgi:hypothetical protein